MPRRQTTHSNTYRFFVPPASFDGDAVRVDDADLARQLSAVLRLGSGDQVVMLDGQGWQYEVTLSAVGKARVAGAIERRALAGGEPRLELAIYAGLMRAERFEWLLQKGTELGAAGFVPVLCERSLAEGAPGEAKIARWERIIREAAEQSRRGRLPSLARPLPFAEACAQAAAAGPALLLWEGQGATSIRAALGGLGRPTALGLLSGPEGGLTDAERERAAAHAIMPVTLGPRTLRAETAPLAAATAALYAFGELGG